MRNWICLLLILFYCTSIIAQESELKRSDYWRQHNLVRFQQLIVNPTYTSIGQENRELALWGRLQWTGVANAPKNFLLTYSGKFGDKIGAGVGLFQSNNGLFTDTGLLVNYAMGIPLSDNMKLAFGLNVIGIKSGLDTSKIVTPIDDVSILSLEDDYSVLVMPGIHLQIGDLDLGIMSENLVAYSFTNSQANTNLSDKVWRIHAGYHINMSSDQMGSLSRMYAQIYGKSIPDTDYRYGGSVLYELEKYGYIQLGYNSFYGVSGGLGVKLSSSFYLGFTVETGLENAQKALGASYEVQAVLDLGKRHKKEKPIAFKEGPKPEKFQERTKSNKSIAEANKQKSKLNFITAKQRDSIRNANVLSTLTKEKLEALEVSKDSKKSEIAIFFPDRNTNRKNKLLADEVGVDYGFYLVANVFSQEYYFKSFYKLLEKRGLQPKWFFSKENQYYYVYLGKYDDLKLAEQQRRNQLNGTYHGDTWVLWVKKD